jgi:hypothetical protein
VYVASPATDVPGEGRAAAVTFVQRFSGNLGLHVHYHSVFADGVWVRASDEARPVFHPAPPPTHDAIERVAARTGKRVLRWLHRRGLVETRPVEERSNELPDEDVMTACLRTASAQGTLATLLEPPTSNATSADAAHDEDFDSHAGQKRASKWAAEVDHFNVHAGTVVGQGRRDELERLLRYGARPVLALDRLSRLADGRYAYRMRYPMRGKTHRVMSPMELLARLSAVVVAPPRFPLLRYAGVFAPASPWRRLVVPGRPTNRTRCCPAHEDPAPPSTAKPVSSPDRPRDLVTDDDVIARAPPRATATTAASTPPALAAVSRGGGTRIDWAQLLRHGLGIEVLRCPRCFATMRPIATVTEPPQVRRMLEHLGEPIRGDVPTRAWDPVPMPWDEPAPPDDWA